MVGPERRTLVNKDSGRLSRLRLGHILSLRPFLTLHDLKLNIIALLQALVAFRLDGAVVDKHIRAVVTSDKPEALRVVKPFHFTFDSRHFLFFSERPGGGTVKLLRS
jgi:hypothetical protein